MPVIYMKVCKKNEIGVILTENEIAVKQKIDHVDFRGISICALHNILHELSENYTCRICLHSHSKSIQKHFLLFTFRKFEWQHRLLNFKKFHLHWLIQMKRKKFTFFANTHFTLVILQIIRWFFFAVKIHLNTSKYQIFMGNNFTTQTHNEKMNENKHKKTKWFQTSIFNEFPEV